MCFARVAIMNTGLNQSEFRIQISKCPTLDDAMYHESILVEPYQSVNLEFKLKMDVFKSKPTHECKGRQTIIHLFIYIEITRIVFSSYGH